MSTTLHQLTGPTAVLAGLSVATRSAAAPASKVMTLGIGIELPQLQAEKTLAAAQQDKTSALYHQWLTPAQFTARFAVDSTTKAKTTQWLTSGGLKIQTSSAVGDYYTATGTVAQIDSLFKVSEGSYHYIDSKLGAMTFVANDVAPSIPVDVPVSQISGLDTVKKFSSEHITGGYDKQFPVTATKATPAVPGAAVDVFDQGLTPRNLWSIYDLPSADLGEGQTAGLFGEGETDSVIADLRLFENYYNFPKVPVRVVRSEGGDESSYGDNAGAIEWNLDSQAITGMAPHLSSLSMYFSKTLYDPDIFQSFKGWADDVNGPTQMNASFGECEAGAGNELTGPLSQVPYGSEEGDELEPVAEAVLMQANIEGRGLFSSAGDTGSGCPDVVVPVGGAGNGVAPSNPPQPNYPCDSSYVTCVGGSVIAADATGNTRTDERNWADTGGGASHYIAAPAFQSKVTAIDLPCVISPPGNGTVPGVPDTTNTGKTCRGVPDVAALSGNILGSGYELFADGAEITTGGTSLSSPLWVGMWSRVSAAQAPQGAKTPTAGTTGGFAAPSLYPLYGADGSPATYAASFYDIVCGEDDVCTNGVDAGAGNGAYTPKAGWDYTSGLGAPNIVGIMTSLGIPRALYAGASSTSEVATTVGTTDVVNSPALNAGNPAVSDPTRTMTPAQTNVPQLDLLSSTMTTSADGSQVIIKLAGTQFDDSIPTGFTGVDYTALWQFGGAEYFVDDSLSMTGDSITTGTKSSATGSTFAGATNATSTATAAFADNVLTLTVPAAEVGSPKANALLSYPLSETSGSAGIAFTADRASASSFTEASVGQAVCVNPCTLVAAPAAATVPAPVIKTVTAAPAVAAKKTLAKKATVKKVTKTVTQPKRTLAFTGLSPVLPLGALVLLAGGAGLARRRRNALR